MLRNRLHTDRMPGKVKMNPWWLALIIPGSVVLTIAGVYVYAVWRAKDVLG